MSDSDLPQMPSSKNNDVGTAEGKKQMELIFPPVRNGTDYLVSVVELLDGDPDPRDLKYAVLHLQAAVEVLLKARLIHEHWSLVFKDPSLAVRSKYEEGDFDSCTTEGAISRLENVVGVTIEPKVRSAIKALTKSRNTLQHYGLTDSAIVIEARAAKVLDFLLGFVHDHLVPGLSEAEASSIDTDMRQVRLRLRDIRSLAKERWKRLPSELKDHLDYTVVCPACGEWALVARGEPTCRFCHEIWELPNFAAWDYMVKALGFSVREAHDAIRTCPECEIDAVVPGALVASSRDTRITLCFTCTWREGLMTCPSCVELVPQNDVGVCVPCRDAGFE
ncbi:MULTISPECIES: hypothetical protein [unclassified Streptomyces]|uniref:hypothetical protein n=1 Tax=unclassified Streptomyces TaxID=2593676 RepID=UPI002E137BFE|nr:hypothetical protein OG279_38575 [Streptomyces sp. NBC_01201]